MVFKREIYKRIGILLAVYFTLWGISLLGEITVQYDASNSLITFPKTTGFWTVDEFEINGNGNWASIASSYPWCSGSGTWNNPYLIENVTFSCPDGDGNSFRIVGSDIYFVLKNCTFTLSGMSSSNQDAGLELYDVENGLIIDCVFINNRQNALFLSGASGCRNNTIQHNTIKNNVKYGVYLYSSFENKIIDNTLLNNSHGIRIHISQNNTIEENFINASRAFGFSFQYGHYNNITGNTVSYSNYNGTYLLASHNNRFDDNFFESNIKSGITLENSNSNNFTGNSISNNQQFGLYFTSSNSTHIERNVINNNLIGDYLELNSKDNVFYNDLLDVQNVPFIIDETGEKGFIWEQVAYMPWCTGSGSLNDPYVIENLNINGEGFEGLSCITIMHSESYFEIKNGTFYSLWDLVPVAGIQLVDSQNGLLVDNNCSYNVIGITLMDDTRNVEIKNNKFDKNGFGIYIENNCSEIIIQENEIRDTGLTTSLAEIWIKDDCNNIVIKNNNISNGAYGIYLYSNCDDISILKNNITLARYNAIRMRIDCDKNEIIGNIMRDNGEMTSGGSDYSGIYIYEECDFTLIQNNSIYNSGDEGIWISYNSDNSSIIDNLITYSGNNGILISNGANNSITRNIISNNNRNGIYLGSWGSLNNLISENLILENLERGIYLLTGVDNAEIVKNRILNNAYEGIYVGDCDYCLIKENYVYNNGHIGTRRGIWLDTCANSTISGNWAYNNMHQGILVSNSDNCNLMDNIANENEYGIYVSSSYNVILLNNVASFNLYFGIVIDSLNNLTLTDCTLQDNYIRGLILQSCNKSVFLNNYITNNPTGIYIASNSDYNTFSGNFVKDSVDYGILIELTSDYNIFYNNYLESNQINALDDGLSSFWNNSYIGNYWSNYTGFDSDDDGIGDLPQNINGVSNSKDYLPLYKHLPPIYINPYSAYSWNWAKNHYWCSGSGTIGDPYIIENKIINFLWSGNCLEIRNSNVYFIIRNCTLMNSGLGFSGILLHNVENGNIADCIIKFNENGIMMESVVNVLIDTNIINENFMGISLSYSDENSITGNTINQNAIGMVLWQSDYNLIKENSLYYNDICIYEFECFYNIFENNDCYPEEPHLLYVEIIDQAYSSSSFNITFYLYNASASPIDLATIQMWWNGVDISADVQNLENGYYFVSLDPIIATFDDDPILLNMTISAADYEDKYFETYITIYQSDLEEDILILEIIDQTFSTEFFNITFFIHNTTGYEIDFATFQIWWNGVDVSTDVQNLENGYYRISLTPIFVEPQDPPILLEFIITVSGYQDLYYPLELAVDPEAVSKEEGHLPPDDFLPLIIGTISGGVAAISLGTFLVLRKRKLKIKIAKEEKP